MTIGETVTTILKNDADVAALVLVGGFYQIYPAPGGEDSQVPRITYQVLAATPYNLLKGGHNGRKAWVQVTSWARTQEAAEDLAAKAALALESAGYIEDGVNEFDSEARLFFVTNDWRAVVA